MFKQQQPTQVITLSQSRPLFHPFTRPLILSLTHTFTQPLIYLPINTENWLHTTNTECSKLGSFMCLNLWEYVDLCLGNSTHYYKTVGQFLNRTTCCILEQGKSIYTILINSDICNKCKLWTSVAIDPLQLLKALYAGSRLRWKMSCIYLQEAIQALETFNKGMVHFHQAIFTRIKAASW